jgi:hypothetical protein
MWTKESEHTQLVTIVKDMSLVCSHFQEEEREKHGSLNHQSRDWTFYVKPIPNWLVNSIGPHQPVSHVI